MAEDSPLSQTIVDRASDAESVTIDGTTTRERTLHDLIEADRYLSARSAAKGNKLPIRLAKIIPGGAA